MPSIAGILLQWYLPLQLHTIIVCSGVVIIIILLYFFLPVSLRYQLRWFHGLGVLILFGTIGCTITFIKDVRHTPNWIGNYYSSKATITVTLEEPLVTKPKSYKALASFETIQTGDTIIKVKGKMLIYIAKDSIVPAVGYGSQIVFNKPLQEITNSGNPGAFDYKRYCLFKDISHQVFLKQSDYIVLPHKNENAFQKWLYDVQQNVINTMHAYIPGKTEQGVAEALLIGYREDLDKELVQSYSNTGVVHIIAISGLHLGLIYGLLVWLFTPFKNKRWYKPVKFIVIFLFLWLFTLIAGAAASILRSAVMFSFILIGEMLSRKTKIYNTLAASAFCLLVYNPFYLWDVGFQLSYAAVISIVAFMKPVYHLIDVHNKMLDKLWQLSSVTIAAQILTLPFILYHFHQFPVLFLLTNLLVVPLSGFILYGLMLLLLVSKIPLIAFITGKVLFGLLWLMNNYVLNMEAFPFALIDNIQLNILQSVLLMILLIACAVWLMYKMQKALIITLTCFASIAVIRSVEMIQNKNEVKLIVYNVPQHSAIDIMCGNKYYFIGDTELTEDGFLQNFHLKPSRILNRTTLTKTMNNVEANENVIFSAHKKIILIDPTFRFKNVSSKMNADVIIISKNPSISIKQIVSAFNCKEIVFDSSNPFYKIERWKKDCDSLHLRFHSVAAQGAYEMQL
ncbi:MAG: ComEC/Rec2 family competence protein [Ilyomonas sp.]